MGMLGQNQNLINPIRIEKIEPAGRPAGFYRSIVLDAIGVIAAFFAGYAYFEFLAKSWPLPVFIGAFLVFTVVFALEALLGEKAWRQMGVLAIETIAFLLPFYSFDRIILGVSAGVIFIFFMIGYLDSRSELNHGVTIRFFKATHGAVANAVTGGLLVAIILYLPVANAGSVFIGESSFTGFFNWAAGVLGNFYPAISFTGSFSDFAQSIAKQELSSNTTFQSMSPSDQSTALVSATNQIETNFAKSIGVAPSAASSMSTIAYGAIKNLLQGWRERFSVWFTAGWGITLFLILRSIGIVAVLIGQFLTMIAYEALLSLGVIRIKQEPRTKEVLEF